MIRHPDNDPGVTAQLDQLEAAHRDIQNDLARYIRKMDREVIVLCVASWILLIGMGGGMFAAGYFLMHSVPWGVFYLSTYLVGGGMSYRRVRRQVMARKDS